MTRPTTPTLPAAVSAAAARRGFTLNELLIVIALAVLILALAIPAFSVITGGRSIESAENRISAYLGAARSDAIGLQQPRGVIFFEDEGTRLVTLAQVYFPPGQNVAAGQPLELDVYGGRDEMVLPNGIGLKQIPNGAGGTMDAWKGYSVIMFDGDGRLLQDPYKLASTGSGLYARVPKGGQNPVAPISTGVQPNIGFVLFDRPAYEEQQGSATQNTWLQGNGVPYLVNRYNGGLLRAE